MRTGLVMYEWTSLDHVGAERILRTREPLDDRLAVRLLPPQLDQRRSGRQPADLRPQHLGRHTTSTPTAARSCGAWAAGTAASRWARARSTAWQHDPRELADGILQHLRQRRLPGRSRAIARASSLSLDAQQRTATLTARSPTRRRCWPKARATCRRSRTATGSSAGASFRTSRSSAPAANCCSTHTSRRTRSHIGLPLRLDRHPRSRSFVRRPAHIPGAGDGVCQLERRDARG